MKNERELTMIRSQVAITDRTTGRDREYLRISGFGAVLCLDRAEFDFDADPEHSPIVAWLQAVEISRHSRETFEGAVEALKTLVAKHGKVAVHCHHGTGRSVAVVAAYLVDTEGVPPQTALVEVAGLRGGIAEVSKALRSMVELRPEKRSL